MLNAAAGLYHSACVDVGGSLFTFDRGDGGRLGIPELKDPNCVGMYCCVPAQVRLPNEEEKAQYLACGDNNSMVITDKGDLYQWGFSMDADITTPTKIDFESEVFVKDVSVGSQHAIVIASKVAE